MAGLLKKMKQKASVWVRKKKTEGEGEGNVTSYYLEYLVDHIAPIRARLFFKFYDLGQVY